MNWQAVIAELQAAAGLIGQVDPAVQPTTEEIAALLAVAGTVVTTVSAVKGVPIEDVIAGLTPEDPIV